MEITKIRMQMQATLPAAERKTTIEVVKSLGVRGMYSGTLATLARDVPFSLLFFPGYANLKTLLADEKGENSVPSQLFAGGIAGAFAAAAVTPSDVIKTRYLTCICVVSKFRMCVILKFNWNLLSNYFRLQLEGGRARYLNMANCFKTILKEEGILALYKGAFPRMVVVGPLFAITLLSFETQKNYMIKHGML
jgi:hypothetical protein